MAQYISYSSRNSGGGGGGGTVTAVTASAPIASSGGTTPNISLTGIVAIANGGTGSATKNFVDLTTAQSVAGVKTFSSILNADSGLDRSTAGNLDIGPTAGTNLRLGHSSGALSIRSDLVGFAASSVINMGANVVSGVADPLAAQDAATKAYVDAFVPSGAINSVSFFNGSGVLSSDINVEYSPSFTPSYPPLPCFGFLAKTDTINANELFVIGTTDTATDSAMPAVVFLTGSNSAVGAANKTGAVGFLSGQVTDATSSAATGDGIIQTGNNLGTGSSGSIILSSGNTVDGTSGVIRVVTGNGDGIGNSGSIEIKSGDAVTNDSGNITIQPGTAAINRGVIALNSDFINFNTGIEYAEAYTPVFPPIPLKGFFAKSDVINSQASALTLSSTDTATDSFTTIIALLTGSNSAVGAASDTGDIAIFTGAVGDPGATARTGGISLQTGQNVGTSNSGNMGMLTGGTVDGDSGILNFQTGAASGIGNSGGVSFNIAGTQSGTSGTFRVSTGDSVSGDSGNISLNIGTAGGTRGKIQLVDGSEGTAGYVWTSTDTGGNGAWMAASGGGANTALSNLASTAVNVDLLPAGSGARALGSVGNEWLSLDCVLIKVGNGSGNTLINCSNALINDTGGNSSVDAGGRILNRFDGSISLDWENSILQASDGTQKISWVDPLDILFFDAHLTFEVNNLPAPTATVLSGAGTGGNASLSGGDATDTMGQINVITGTLSLASGGQMRLDFGSAYAVAPRVQLTPANAAAATAAVNVYVTASTTDFTINFVNAGLISTTYTWNYFVVGGI